MKTLSLLTLAVSALAFSISAHAKEETVVTSDNRKIGVNLPDGFTLQTTQQNGVVSLDVVDAKKSVSLHLDLVPDPNARLGDEESQKNMLAELSQNEAEQSVEKGYDFQPLEPKNGAGLFLVLTDATLVGKTPPAGEYHMLTRGVKSWSGFAVIFSLVSQDNTSDAYLAVMKVLKQSVEEKKPSGPTL